MKQIIRITENELHRMISECVRSVVNEMAGDGASSTFGVNSPAGSLSDPTGQQKNHIDAPVGKVQRRKGYSPKGNAKGDVTKQSSNVDMSPALDRKGGENKSIIMNHI